MPPAAPTGRRFGATTLDQAFDPVGRLLTQTLTNTATPTTTPNPRPADPLLRRDYGYSIDGLLTGLDDLHTGVHRYTHDPTGQVTNVLGPTGDERYDYDPSGNLTHATWPTPGDDPDPGPRGPREYTGTLITRAGNTTYTHDRAGRLTQRRQKLLSGKTRTWTYTWDAHDRLSGVRTPDGTHWRYTYDALGRRVSKQRLSGDPADTDVVTADAQVTEQTRFTWDGPTLAETAHTPTGRVTTFDYQPGTFTPLTQRTHTHPTNRDGDTPDQTWYDQQFHAIITDLIGTPHRTHHPRRPDHPPTHHHPLGHPPHPHNHPRQGHAPPPTPVPRPIP